MSLDNNKQLHDNMTRLGSFAHTQQRGVDELLNEIINRYLEQQEHVAFLARAKASEQLYKDSGRHITLDELADWVEKYHTDEEYPLPQCHN